MTDQVIIMHFFFSFVAEYLLDGVVEVVLLVGAYNSVFGEKRISDQIEVLFNSLSAALNHFEVYKNHVRLPLIHGFDCVMRIQI